MAKPNLDEKERKIYRLSKAEEIMEEFGQDTLAKVKAEKKKEKDDKGKEKK